MYNYRGGGQKPELVQRAITFYISIFDTKNSHRSMTLMARNIYNT